MFPLPVIPYLTNAGSLFKNNNWLILVVLPASHSQIEHFLFHSNVKFINLLDTV